MLGEGETNESLRHISIRIVKFVLKFDRKPV